MTAAPDRMIARISGSRIRRLQTAPRRNQCRRRYAIENDGDAGALSVARRPGLAPELLGAATDMDVELPDFLAQGVAVQAEDVGRADLIAVGRLQRESQQ